LAIAAAVVAAGTAGISATPAHANGVSVPPPHLTAIHPGAPQLRPTPIRINVVLVGYQPGAVDTNRLLSTLPSEAAPIMRFPAYRGLFYSVGNDLQYRYSIRAAGTTFDNQFFGYLSHAGKVGPPDFQQSLYNGQVHRSLTIGPSVRFIDAKDTEKWLETAATYQLKINPADYTVFLVNWYGRSDFQFHTFTNRSNPDPDTGIDARVTLGQTHVRAWGGTSGPTWFFDLSAGPVFTDTSWNVDDVTITSPPGTMDYRIPPAWDYGHTGYRAFNDLTGDLAALVRYVGTDELFASSPIFDPAATLSLPGTGKTIAVDIFEGDPALNGAKDIHPSAIWAAHQALEPYLPINVTVRDFPLTGAVQTAYDTATLLSVSPGCWNAFGSPITEFVCYFMGNYPQYFPTNTQNAVVPVVGFTVADNPGSRIGLLGVTDDDFATGTPTLIEEFDGPPLRYQPNAYAYTHLTTHEAGHFMGLSHPHDGEDPAGFFDFGPGGAFYYVWAGDQSDSAMSYLNGNSTFDVLDVDNLARDNYARLSILADFISGDVLAQPPNAAAYALLLAADAEYHLADAAVRGERWLSAAEYALAGFRDIQRAQQAVGLLPASTPGSAGPVSASSSAAAQVSANLPQLVGTQVRAAVLQRGASRPCEVMDTCSISRPGGGH
jgi:hypothetical protein